MSRDYSKEYFGEDKAKAKEKLLALIAKADKGESLTEQEQKVYAEYRDETGAFMAQRVLGTKSFIKKLIQTETSTAEKVLNKVRELYESFKNRKSKDAQNAAEYLHKAEQLYLDALSEVGGTYQNGKIHLANREEGEELTRVNSEKTHVGGEKGGENVTESINPVRRIASPKSIDSDANKGYNGNYINVSADEYAIIGSCVMNNNAPYIANGEPLPKHGSARTANFYYVYENIAHDSFGVVEQVAIVGNESLIQQIDEKIGAEDGKAIIRSAKDVDRVLEILENISGFDSNNHIINPGGLANSTNGEVDASESQSDGERYSRKSRADQKSTLTVNGEALNPISHTYTDDVALNRRKVLCYGKNIYRVENARKDTALYYPTADAAIEAENESLIKGYAKEFFLSPAEVKRKLDADPDLLSRARDNGIRFSRKATGETVTISKGEMAKLHANYAGDKVFDKKSVSEALKGIDALQGLPAEIRNDFINRVWTGYNKHLHQQGFERFTEVIWHHIHAAVLQENGFEMTEAEIAKMDEQIVNALHQIVASGKQSIRARPCAPFIS